MKKMIGMLSAVSLGVVLTACSSNPEETIHTHFETAVEEEAVFAEQQAPLQEAEQQEQTWYDEIIELGMDDFDSIVTLTNQALESVETRREMIEDEKAGIEAGYEEASKAESEFENIENEDTRNLASDVQEAMDNRYESYNTLYSLYEESLDLDQQLYELLGQEDLDVSQLEEQIELVNEKYNEITEATETFNSHTDTYNEAKKSFYESADLDVEFS
ncbi:YkyA family protein [Alkalicoccobacillus murimartini]|uniref:Nucleic acid-binding Zn-ribbon protein n=1 Tax=Alkalicoccobacillus murimartini TaxID=171685 RepID=A0ABT9YHK4_9BACI|nr:YkyA family protein [Alkalicoccobacillus murimartini]MDQ0206504.1 putative nucleic acid-binding Zn-ribbon protein [Alkalicoccobacillus murimartini]